MPGPSVQVLAAYRVELTPELFARAMEIKYGGLDLNEGQRASAEERVRDEISNAVLLEVLVADRDSRFDVGDFGQEDSNQAPYDEHFLSENGEQVIASGFDVPTGSRLRVAFFLHYLDPRGPLRTSYGQVAIPPIEPMPSRLRELMPYEPVD